MANYYSQSAESFVLSDDQLDLVCEYLENNTNHELVEKVFSLIDNGQSPLNILEKWSHEHGRFCFYTESLVAIDVLAEALKFALNLTGDTRQIVIQGALTCSEPRPSAFGGFAYIVTGESIRAMSTDMWAHYHVNHYVAVEKETLASIKDALGYLVDTAEWGIDNATIEARKELTKKLIEKLKEVK